MKTYEIWIGTGLVGSTRRDTFEIEDDATEEQIEEAARDTAFNYLEWGYRPIED